MCNPPKIPSMNDIGDQLARVNQQAREIIANPLSAISVLVLGPILGLIGAAVATDQMQNATADAAAQDNQIQLDAVAQQEADANQAQVDAQKAADDAQALSDQATKDAQDAADQAAKDALAAQQAAGAMTPDQVAQAATQSAALDTGGMPSGGGGGGGVPSFPSGGGGGGGGGMPVDASMLTSESPFDTGGPQPVDQSMFMQDMGPMPPISALELSPELQEMVSAPMDTGDFSPVDETDMLTVSEDPFAQEDQFQGFGRVTNYPEAEGIAFSRINPQSLEPVLSYDERYAPRYVESGSMFPVPNMLNSRRNLPSTGFMPTAGNIIKDFNNPMFQPQDIPDNLLMTETNYPTHGGQTATNIKRSVLSTAMPIRSDFGDAQNQPSAFDFMLNDLRMLQSNLGNIIKKAEGFKTYDKRFSGMMNMADALAPIKSDLNEVAGGVKHVERANRNIRPRTREDQEKAYSVKQMINDMNDDIALVRHFVH
jgi:hypothetical protein